MTYKSKSKIKSYAHKTRYKIALNLCKTAKSVFDYGTGSAYFPRLLSENNPQAEIVGYEPIQEIYEKAEHESKEYKNIKIVNKIDFSQKYDCVTCLEVMEHLTEEEQIKIIQECIKLVSEKGQFIISVPIETGLSSLFKNIIRYLIRQSHAKTFKEVILALFGMKMERKVENGFIYSHVGFRYKDLEKLLTSQNLKITRRIFSPFSFLGAVLNSQVFFIVDLD